MSKRSLPEINAGSMADIAFLLLIFFLVTTTMDVDSGIFKKLPDKQERPPIDHLAKNTLEIYINKNNKVRVDDEEINLDDLKQMALNFIDNGGGLDVNKQPCTWCKGKKDPKSSDHPSKAVIAIESDRLATYETYVSVLDQVNSAYTILRNRFSLEKYNTSYTEFTAKLQEHPKNKEVLMNKIQDIRSKYPQLVADVEQNN